MILKHSFLSLTLDRHRSRLGIHPKWKLALSVLSISSRA